MILNADHMARSGHFTAARSSRTSFPKPEWLALKNKAFVQRPHDLLRRAKILVIALSLTDEEGMHRVVEVVTPDGIQSISAAAVRPHHPGVILVCFRDHADLALKIARERLHFLR